MDIMGPEGPRMNLLRIGITPYQLNAIKNSKFVRLCLKSKDGDFALDMVVKDVDAFLELVPSRMPGIEIQMNAEAFAGNVESRTIIMLEDGLGNNKGYKIAALQPVELMNSGWWPAKKRFPC
jgi:hypothetical protein